jgi:hypothetical protein
MCVHHPPAPPGVGGMAINNNNRENKNFSAIKVIKIFSYKKIVGIQIFY